MQNKTKREKQRGEKKETVEVKETFYTMRKHHV